ncbi:MAG: 1-deoxy-D-xylulose-5-phosphate synthase [Candidatus Saganbacteria bacterium]|uniref:1-deoxy-D-xylulose-5-phosphate synthase n=1 Tax=Candidatus Saganbacteria bacterium TaxID=2575572 RepID=A0A833L2S8_UNCSA|nr:MAG: 1-deoxy-D-xylulose-5-phosphate synthase [Candidatus Saganbacteria bacterium]
MTTLLDKIKLPDALRELSGKQLEQIAQEVRQKIIEVTSHTGGHVASSLGAVELAVALHAVFESPKDKIIWDVGHQAYSHKLLTGRLDRFETLRQYHGISGFPNYEESPHDIFTVGHASTSISQALGLVRAKELLNENYSVIAVIGDGSLSGGMSFEGVNNVDGLKSNLIVILNDNEMSISKNVGSISNYLTAVRTSDLYVDLRNRIESIVKKVPKYGVSLFEAARRLKDRTRQIVMNFKVDVIFEELGFTYFGPIDGHNIPLLMSTLHHAKEIQGPVLIHVLTKKGKGYLPAEAEPTRFHGTGAYDILTGHSLSNGSKAPSYTQTFGKTMCELAEKDEKIIAVTAAMIDGTGLEDFEKKYPSRFFDVGIAEEHAVAFAGALAKKGLTPVVAVYSTFLQRAYDQIMHDVSLQNLPVVFAVDRAGIVGEDGATHNGIFDIAFLRTVPNMVIMSPKDENELRNMLFTAVHHKNGPIAIRYPRAQGHGVKPTDYKNPDIGTGEVAFSAKVHKILIIALGSMVYPSVEAAELLEKENVGSIVINARFAKPLDNKLILKYARGADLVITVEEGIINGGFGSAVLELLAKEKISVSIIGLPDKFIEHGKREEILELFGLTTKGIYKRVKNEI